jgi:hypothetical protein
VPDLSTVSLPKQSEPIGHSPRWGKEWGVDRVLPVPSKRERCL